MTRIETREDLELKAFYAFDEFKREEFPIHKKDLESIAEAGLIPKENAKDYLEAYKEVVKSVEAALTVRGHNGERYAKLYTKIGFALGTITSVSLFYLTGIEDLCSLTCLPILTTGTGLVLGDRVDRENKILEQELSVNFRKYKHYLSKISNIDFKEAEQKCAPDILERARKHFEFYNKLLEEGK